jgi:hypothetical protein
MCGKGFDFKYITEKTTKVIRCYFEAADFMLLSLSLFSLSLSLFLSVF